jgi:Tol biopolymer transport system component
MKWLHPWRCRPLGAAVLGLIVPALVDAQPATTRVSVGSGGIQANHPSVSPAISADGRWVAFSSSANNLVPNDTNDTEDVFLHDRQTGTTNRVSVGPGGAQGNGPSSTPSISANGRWVAFQSLANNLVPGDTNDWLDVFVHDRDTGVTSRVSVGPGGAQGNLESRSAAISADGRWVAFASASSTLVVDDTNDVSDVFLHDRQTATTIRVSQGPGGAQGNQSSDWPAISAGGLSIAFTSLASNLVADDTNGWMDTFVHDRTTGTTTRVSVGTGGIQGNDASYFWPAISGDGRRVAYQSAASNLVAGDTNGQHDVFVHDRPSGTTTRVSIGPGGLEGNQWSEFPAISADGRWVVFDSASTLVTGDANGVEDVFLHDLQTGTLRRVSVDPMSVEGNGRSFFQSISADGRWVAFASWASNLVAGDTNDYRDIFARDLVQNSPLPPTGLVVDAVVGNVVTLRWTNPSFGPAPAEFVIEGGTSPGEVLAALPTGSAAPTFTFSAPAGSFYLRVHALNGAFRSAASNEVRIHVNVPVAPSAPANVLGLVNGATLTLAWRNTYEGGTPSSIVLDVTGAITMTVSLGLGETVTVGGVPPGTYTLRLRAQNTAGSSPPSNAVTLTFPGPCSGPPATPAGMVAYHVGSTVFVAWSPGASGPAPTAYVLIVTGSYTGSVATSGRTLSGAVGPGTYTVNVVAVNACGVSAGTSPQTMVVP